MHINASTEKRSNMTPKVGEHVLAKVDAKGHAVFAMLRDDGLSAATRWWAYLQMREKAARE